MDNLVDLILNSHIKEATKSDDILKHKYAIRISSMETTNQEFDVKLSKLINSLQSKGTLLGCIEQPDKSHYHTHLFFETTYYTATSGLRDLIQKTFSYKAVANTGFKPIMVSDKTRSTWTMETSAFYFSKGFKAKALPGQEKKKTLKVYDINTKLPFNEGRYMLLNSNITEEFLHMKYTEFWERSRLMQNSKMLGDRTHYERLHELCTSTFQKVGPNGLMQLYEPTVKQMIALVCNYFAKVMKTKFGPNLVADYVNLMMYEFGPPTFKIELEQKIYDKFFSNNII